MTGDELFDALRALRAERAAAVRAAWRRDLPLADYIVDRWERARELGFGAGTSVYDQALVLGDVHVGEKTWIGPGTVLDGSGGLTIGSTCSISAGVQIYTHDSVRWALSGGDAPYEHAPVAIGDCTYVGPCAVIAKGVTIGRRCVVGAHSFVNRDLPDDSIAVGAPCRIVGRVVEAGDGSLSLTYTDRDGA